MKRDGQRRDLQEARLVGVRRSGCLHVVFKCAAAGAAGTVWKGDGGLRSGRCRAGFDGMIEECMADVKRAGERENP